MNYLSKSYGKLITVACCLIAMLFVERASAIETIYNIKEDQSSITISGTINTSSFGSSNIDPQAAGTLTATYSGTIRADRGAGTIEFLGGSSIVADLQSINLEPAIGGGAGDAPGNYGGLAFTGFAALAGRDFIADLINGGVLPISSGNFSLDDVDLSFASGSIDFNATLFSGQESIIGDIAPLTNASGQGSISSVGPEMITIPINTTLLIDLGVDNATANLTLSGQLVAIVPEPSAVILVAFAAVGCTGITLMRRQNRTSN